MRFVLFSDNHFHNWSHISLEDQRLAINEILYYAESNDIKLILFCGDFFHTHGTLKTSVAWHFHGWLEDIKSYGIQLLAIAGNHDYADRYGGMHALTAVELIGNDSHVIDSHFVEVDGIKIYGFDYTDDKDYLKSYLDSIRGDSLLLLHQGVSGVEVNSKGFMLNEVLTPDMLPDNVIHAFTGHYHTYHRASPKLTIPGALIQHGWVDAPEIRGFLDVYIDGDKNVHVQKIPSTYGTHFAVVDYKEAVACETSLEITAIRNIKILNCPSESAAAALREKQFRIAAARGTLHIEVIRPEIRVPLEVEMSSFSSVELFNEYTKARSLNSKHVEIGKKLIGVNSEVS